MREAVEHLSRPVLIASLGLALALALALLGGCSTGGAGPRLDGSGAGTRSVRVGDVMDLRLPLNDDAERAWRISEYDSAYLALVGAPGVVSTDGRTRPGGRGQMRIQVRAKQPGATALQVTEILTGEELVSGKRPRVVRFTIRIGD